MPKWIHLGWISQYHCCWCPGDARSQGISSNDIDCRRNRSLSSRRKAFNYLCYFSLRKDRKCKYIFIFPEMNWAWQGLNHLMQDTIFSVQTTSLPWLLMPWLLDPEVPRSSAAMILTVWYIQLLIFCQMVRLTSTKQLPASGWMVTNAIFTVKPLI